MANDCVKMRGPLGGTVQTSAGPVQVAPDGSFWVPASDVQAFLDLGCYLAGPGVGSVQIGNYVLYEDNNGILQCQMPNGSTVPALSGGTITAVASTPTFNVANQNVIFAEGFARTINLPEGPTVGYSVTVKDIGGIAVTNGLRVATLDGSFIDNSAGPFLFEVPYESVEFMWNGNQWSLM